jgi:hypothetical protein
MEKPQFLFGSSQVTITPKDYSWRTLSGFGRWTKCKGIHDLIWVRVNIFVEPPNSNKPFQGLFERVKLVLINYDLTGFGFRNLHRLRDLAYQELGIEKNTIHTFATHSHYGPDTEGLMPGPIFPEIIFRNGDKLFVNLVLKQTVKAIKMAMKDLIPVKMGYGRVQFRDRMIFNRRPPHGYYSIIHPYINILRFDDNQGRMVGAISVFPSHPVMIPSTLNKITGAWPLYYTKVIRKYIQDYNKKLNEEKNLKENNDRVIIPMYIQGPAGNVTGHYHLGWWKKGERPDLKPDFFYTKDHKFAEFIANYTISKIGKIKTEPLTNLGINSKYILIPLVPVYEKLDKQGWYNILLAVVKLFIIVPVFRIFRGGPISFLKMERSTNKDFFKRRLCIKTIVTALSLNDVIIAGNPGEPFYNVEKEIKQRTNYEKIFMAELCDDCIGYNWTDIPTVFKPHSYDGQMNYSNLTGILTRNTVIKLAKELIKKIEK